MNTSVILNENPSNVELSLVIPTDSQSMINSCVRSDDNDSDVQNESFMKIESCFTLCDNQSSDVQMTDTPVTHNNIPSIVKSPLIVNDNPTTVEPSHSPNDNPAFEDSSVVLNDTPPKMESSEFPSNVEPSVGASDNKSCIQNDSLFKIESCFTLSEDQFVCRNDSLPEMDAAVVSGDSPSNLESPRSADDSKLHSEDSEDDDQVKIKAFHNDEIESTPTRAKCTTADDALLKTDINPAQRDIVSATLDHTESQRESVVAPLSATQSSLTPDDSQSGIGSFLISNESQPEVASSVTLDDHRSTQESSIMRDDTKTGVESSVIVDDIMSKVLPDITSNDVLPMTESSVVPGGCSINAAASITVESCVMSDDAGAVTEPSVTVSDSQSTLESVVMSDNTETVIDSSITMEDAESRRETQVVRDDAGAVMGSSVSVDYGNSRLESNVMPDEAGTMPDDAGIVTDPSVSVVDTESKRESCVVLDDTGPVTGSCVSLDDNKSKLHSNVMSDDDQPVTESRAMTSDSETDREPSITVYNSELKLHSSVMSNDKQREAAFSVTDASIDSISPDDSQSKMEPSVTQNDRQLTLNTFFTQNCDNSSLEASVAGNDSQSVNEFKDNSTVSTALYSSVPEASRSSVNYHVSRLTKLCDSLAKTVESPTSRGGVPDPSGSVNHISAATEYVNRPVLSVADSSKSCTAVESQRVIELIDYPPQTIESATLHSGVAVTSESMSHVSAAERVNISISSSADSSKSCKQIEFGDDATNKFTESVASHSGLPYAMESSVTQESVCINQSVLSAAEREFNGDTAKYAERATSHSSLPDASSSMSLVSAPEYVSRSVLPVVESSKLCKQVRSEPSQVICIDDNDDDDYDYMDYSDRFDSSVHGSFSELSEAAARKRQCSMIGSYAELSVSEDSDDNAQTMAAERRNRHGLELNGSLKNGRQKVLRTR